MPPGGLRDNKPPADPAVIARTLTAPGRPPAAADKAGRATRRWSSIRCPVAPWELRIRHLRVYFDVEETPWRVVKIRAVGLKDRDEVLIGGERVDLR